MDKIRSRRHATTNACAQLLAWNKSFNDGSKECTKGAGRSELTDAVCARMHNKIAIKFYEKFLREFSNGHVSKRRK